MPASMEMSVMPRVTHVPLDASHKPTCSTAGSLLAAWQSTWPPAALLPVSDRAHCHSWTRLLDMKGIRHPSTQQRFLPCDPAGAALLLQQGRSQQLHMWWEGSTCLRLP